MTLASGSTQQQAVETTQRAESGSLSGYVDAIVSGRIYGWAWDASQPDRSVTVEVRDGDRVLGTVEADRFREDLRNLGLGNGRHAFEFELPDGMRDAASAKLKIVYQESGAELPRNGQLTFSSAAGAEKDAAAADRDREASPDLRLVEENLTKLANLMVSMHGQLSEQRAMLNALREARPAAPAASAEVEAGFAGINQRLDRLAVAMTTTESFLLRSDERLRQMWESNDASDLEGALRREIRGMALILLCAIAGVAAMLLTL